MTEVVNITDHSNDLARNLGAKTPGVKLAGCADDSFAKRIFIRPEAPCHRFADDHDIRCAMLVAIRELTPSYQWETDGSEVRRADADVPGSESLAGFLWPAFDGESPPLIPADGRKVGCRRGRHNSRNRTDALEYTFEIRGD